MAKRLFVILLACLILVGNPGSYIGVPFSTTSPAHASLKNWIFGGGAICLRLLPCRGAAGRVGTKLALKAGEKILTAPPVRQGMANLARRTFQRLLGKEVSVYRVEGAVNTRVLIGDKGHVGILDNGKTLFLNFGDKARANAFLAKRGAQNMEGAALKEFRVSKDYVQALRESSVPERLSKMNPGKPIQVDTSKTLDSFGLKAENIQGLIDAIIPGSGKLRL